MKYCKIFSAAKQTTPVIRYFFSRVHWFSRIIAALIPNGVCILSSTEDYPDCSFYTPTHSPSPGPGALYQGTAPSISAAGSALGEVCVHLPATSPKKPCVAR